MILHPLYRNTRYAMVDTSTKGQFCYGFDRAIACWRSGCTVESITNAATKATPKDRGVIAACEMLLGWHDTAEREARAHGMTREEATTYVAAQHAISKAP